MRSIQLLWHGRPVGTIEVPDSFRPPITQAELDRIPAMLIVRSRSWLFDVRPGDVRLELRTAEGRDDIVAIANDRLGPGDIGCIVGFTPTAGAESFVDEEMIATADRIAREQGASSR